MAIDPSRLGEPLNIYADNARKLREASAAS